MAYRGMMDCFVRTVREEGLGALFKGLAPNYVKVVPSIAIAFVTYEQVGAVGWVGGRGCVWVAKGRFGSHVVLTCLLRCGAFACPADRWGFMLLLAELPLLLLLLSPLLQVKEVLGAEIRLSD